MNVWSSTPKGAQSGDILARDCRLDDARLIAAAPDLLDLLQELVSRFDEDNLDTAEHGFVAFIDRVHEAIARASVVPSST